MFTLTLADVASILSLPAPSNPELPITGVNTLDAATESEVSFLSSDQYLKQLPTTKAAAVIVQKRVKLPPETAQRTFVVDDADLALGLGRLPRAPLLR